MALVYPAPLPVLWPILPLVEGVADFAPLGWPSLVRNAGRFAPEYAFRYVFVVRHTFSPFILILFVYVRTLLWIFIYEQPKCPILSAEIS